LYEHTIYNLAYSQFTAYEFAIKSNFRWQGRTNLPPEKVPWEALVTLLSQCIYGGKIDNLFDQRLLHSFLCKLFTPRSFEADFALVANVDGVSHGIIYLVARVIRSCSALIAAKSTCQ
jgi:hypothetical protein